MKKKILASFFFLSLILASSPSDAQQKVEPVFDQRTWKLGWSKNENGSVFEEYVLEGEVVENWSELVTIQFYPGIQTKIKAAAYAEQHKAGLTKTCPTLKWEYLSQSESDILWKWTVTDCPGQPNQSELCRLVATDEGFHIWHYAIKKSPLPPANETTWLANLKAMQTVNAAPAAESESEAANEDEDEDEEDEEDDATE